ncbi:MAG: HAMP domain-containing protein [Myxococcota bacterium]
MDIRTRLIFALVAISLVSMAALGAFGYEALQDLLLTNQLRKLDAVATSKTQDLERVRVAWIDRVRLVTSQPQLREALDAASRGEPGEHEAILQQILGDARQSVTSLHGIQLFSPEGNAVARTGLFLEEAAPGSQALAAARENEGVREVLLGPEGELLVSLLSPVWRDGRWVGTAWVLLSARELQDVTADYTGLGETGETLLVRAEGNSGAVMLTPLRHDPNAALRRRVRASEVVVPAWEAASGIEGTFRQAIDYRGERVYAASRWIDSLGWGLVAKIDVAEERFAVVELRDTLFKLGLALSAFGIVAGTVLGLLFSRRLLDLADVARRVGDGEWDLRANERPDDEIGQLGMSFNVMARELVAANRELESRLRKSEDPS